MISGQTTQDMGCATVLYHSFVSEMLTSEPQSPQPGASTEAETALPCYPFLLCSIPSDGSPTAVVLNLHTVDALRSNFLRCSLNGDSYLIYTPLQLL